MTRRAAWTETAAESSRLALDSLRTQPGRSGLAIVGIVIGIVTVVLVASLLAGVRTRVAQLFRDLGTENLFAYHLTGDPYAPPTEAEAQRRPLDPAFAKVLGDYGESIRDVAVQLIVPVVQGGRILTARGGGNESDTVLVEGVSGNFSDVTAAEFEAGRPIGAFDDRAAAPVCVVGANVANALFGRGQSVGKTLVLGGETYFVVGESSPRKGGFFGENRQDNIVSIPLRTAQQRFPDAEAAVLYIRSEQGRREDARREAEGLLRRLRKLAPDQPSDFALTSADQIIGQLDQLGAVIGLVTVGLAAVSLFIGGIGITNVMIIAVTERTREIGVRMAIGASRRTVLRQFLLESAFLSTAGGILGIAVASGLGLLVSLLAPGLSTVPPLWIVAAGLLAAVATGIVAGYWPARRAAALDPVEALRYE